MTAAWLCMGHFVCGCAGMKAARMMKESGAALMRRKVEREEEA